PSVMARIAARSGAFARLASAAPAERPQLITSSTARAAAARAGAPGAQGVLAKLPPCEGHAVRVVAYGDPPAPGPLHLGHTQAATTAAHKHEITLYGDDHTRIGAFNVFSRSLSCAAAAGSACAARIRSASPSSAVSATGQGLKARTWRSISRASRLQSMRASAFSMRGAYVKPSGGWGRAARPVARPSSVPRSAA